MAALAAVLAVAQAVLILDKRLARVVDLESQIGRLPTAVDWLYTYVQRAYKWMLLAIAVAGVAAFIGFVLPGAAAFEPIRFLRDHGSLLFVTWLVVGALMYTNAFSHAAERTASLWLGEDHPARHALWALVDLNENAKPLVVKNADAEALADSLLRKLQSESGDSDRAVPPDRPGDLTPEDFRSQLGNGLLIACVIEQAHYDLGLSRRRWNPFYAAVGRLVRVEGPFAVLHLREKALTERNTDQIIQELNRVLQEQSENGLESSPVLRERLRQALNALATQYEGDAVKINAGGEWTNERRLPLMFKRLSNFPGLVTEGIRANFVKLAVVWGVWQDVPLAKFLFPFSHQIAALLLDRGVIRAPDDLKSIAFEHPRETRVAQVGERMVVSHVIRAAENDREAAAKWLPSKSAGTSGEVFRWWVAYEADYRLWEYSRRLHGGTAEDGLFKWRYKGGQVSRIS